MKETKKKKVYSIVVTYNGMKWIEDCFSSLVNSDEIDHTIIAIDNGSKDDTLIRLRSDFEQVKIIETKNNLGFGKANNIGILKAIEDNADYVFLLNQDAWITPNTIFNLISILEKNKNLGVVSPIQMNKNGEIDKLFKTYLPIEYYQDLEVGCLKSLYLSDFVNAASWLLPNRTIREVGIFDPIFFHYGEDVNFCQRVLFHSYKIGIATNLEIIHDRGDRITPKSIQYKRIINVAILLQILTNINYSLISRILKYYYVSLKELIKSLFRLDVNNVIAFLLTQLVFLKKIGQINFSRKFNKKTFCNTKK